MKTNKKQKQKQKTKQKIIISMKNDGYWILNALPVGFPTIFHRGKNQL